MLKALLATKIVILFLFTQQIPKKLKFPTLTFGATRLLMMRSLAVNLAMNMMLNQKLLPDIN